jgi:alkylhydroperoxidase family enzyme
MRIRGLEANEAGWSVRWLYWYLRRTFGKMLTPYKVWAHRPGITLGFTAMTAALEYSHGADSITKALVSIRAAQMVGCPF